MPAGSESQNLCNRPTQTRGVSRMLQGVNEETQPAQEDLAEAVAPPDGTAGIVDLKRFLAFCEAASEPWPLPKSINQLSPRCNPARLSRRCSKVRSRPGQRSHRRAPPLRARATVPRCMLQDRVLRIPLEQVTYIFYCMHTF